MKKYKFIALALVLAVMLMGAGYAYWTETLTISSTVTTGDMNVVFAPPNIAGDYDGKLDIGDILGDLWEEIIGADGEDIILDQAPDMEVSVEPSSDYKRVEFNITDMYPGTGGFLSFSIVNDGTVPVTLENITYGNLVDNDNLKDKLNYIIHPVKVYKYYSESKIVDGIMQGLDLIEWLTTEPIYCDTFNEYITELSNIMSDVTLKPGEYIDTWGNAIDERGGYNIEMPSSITSDALEDATFSFDLQLNYVQGE